MVFLWFSYSNDLFIEILRRSPRFDARFFVEALLEAAAQASAMAALPVATWQVSKVLDVNWVFRGTRP